MTDKIQVAYICDRRTCDRDCDGRGCNHTLDISHAKNFELVAPGKYMEIDKEIPMKPIKPRYFDAYGNELQQGSKVYYKDDFCKIVFFDDDDSNLACIYRPGYVARVTCDKLVLVLDTEDGN